MNLDKPVPRTTPFRIGFDIGGTFTDVAVVEKGGRLRVEKRLSLLESVGREIFELAETHAPADDHSYVHATTVCSNAIIEGDTGRTGLITTAGFRDVLQMQNLRRPPVYDYQWDRVPALVPRHLRLEITERILADGSEETPLDPAEVEHVIRELQRLEVEAIAVCLINSYMNPRHELQVGEIATLVAPGLPVSLSTPDFAEVNEYERTSSVTINAALVPVVERYMTRLEEQLDAEPGTVHVMQSNGGLMASSTARRVPARMIGSGPAAGVLAAARLANELGLDQVLVLDMGGTTAKASVVIGGQPLERRITDVAGAEGVSAAHLLGADGHVLRLPSIDVVEVGAGGGSIAWIDQGGGLRVGPGGAGADPGPACYMRGGVRPTVTDANVVLGYMNRAEIADGSVPIKREAAANAIQEYVADPLDVSLQEAAVGIVRVADATMTRAIRAVTVERGIDPRTMTMIAFGGAGPLHAARLAEGLGIHRVSIPIEPGVFSAIGLLLAEYRQDAVRGMFTQLTELSSGRLERIFGELQSEVRDKLSGIFGGHSLTFTREVDIRYESEDAAIGVELPSPDTDVAAAFQQRHMTQFGYVRDEAAMIVAVRMIGTAAAADVSFRALAPEPARPGEAADIELTRLAYFGAEEGWLPIPVLTSRSAVAETQSPFVIDEPNTSILVPPGWMAGPGDLGTVELQK